MLGAHAYLIGAIPAILFLAVVMMPFYYLCRTHSAPGYLKLRYGEGARSTFIHWIVDDMPKPVSNIRALGFATASYRGRYKGSTWDKV